MNAQANEILTSIEQTRTALDKVSDNAPANSNTDCLTGKQVKSSGKELLNKLRVIVSHEEFTTFFGRHEISQIKSSLNAVRQYTNNTSQVVAQLRSLRNHIRSCSWMIGLSDEELEKIEEIRKKVSSVRALEKKNEKLEEINKSLQVSLSSAQKNLATIKTTIDEVEAEKVSAQKNAQAISSALSSSQNNAASIEGQRKSIDEFTQKITSREKDLEIQKKETETYKEALANFKKEHEETRESHKATYVEKLEAVEKLIEEAREALNLNTSRGLSQEFQSRADSLKPGLGFKFQKSWIPFKSTGNSSGWWIIFSFLFIVSSVALGAFLIWKNPAGEWHQMLARLSTVGLLVTASIFYARQYTKDKHIREDYLYKKVVSASLPAFAENLEGLEKDTSLSPQYLMMALKEVHKHPFEHLRKQKEVDIKDVLQEHLETLTSIIKASKE